MRERPILFSGPMVRAILDGAKTQTRRALLHKGAPVHQARTSGAWRRLHDGLWYWLREDGEVIGGGVRCPYGQPGDRLWVREAWGLNQRLGYAPDTKRPVSARSLHFRATAPDADVGCWRPSIHMPRWASRLTLDVVSVRVERLQALSDEDIAAEGVTAEIAETLVRTTPGALRKLGEVYHSRLADPLYRWHVAWTLINGRESWDANPWVWALTFARVEQEARAA